MSMNVEEATLFRMKFENNKQTNKNSPVASMTFRRM